MRHCTDRLHEHGLTLVEIIAALVLTGVVAGLTTLFLSTGMNGYITTQRNTEASFKSHVALTRLGQELKSLATMSASTSTSITFTNGDEEQRGVVYDTVNCPDSICLQDLDNNITAVLINDVASFAVAVTMADMDSDGTADEISAVDVQFTLIDIPTTFRNTIFPRNQTFVPLTI